MEMKTEGNQSKKLPENVHLHRHHQGGDHRHLEEGRLHQKRDLPHLGKNLHLPEGGQDQEAEEFLQGAGLQVLLLKEARERDQPRPSLLKYI